MAVELMCMDMTSTVIVAENSVCTVNDAAGRVVAHRLFFLIRLKTLIEHSSKKRGILKRESPKTPIDPAPWRTGRGLKFLLRRNTCMNKLTVSNNEYKK